MKLLFSILASICLVFVSCEKLSDQDILLEESTIIPSESTSLRSISAPSTFEAPLFDLFSRHFRYYRGTNPNIYFSEEFTRDFRQKLAIEKIKLERFGFDRYADHLEQTSVISAQSSSFLKKYHGIAQNAKSQPILIKEIRDQLIHIDNPVVIGIGVEQDPLYYYLYNIVFEVVNNYYSENSAQVRSDCPFADLIRAVIESAAAGAGIGTAVGGAVEWLFNVGEVGAIKVLGKVISVGTKLIGTVVGSVVGGIVGLVTHDDDACQDCGEVAFVGIDSDSDCDLTRTFTAYGAGPDALAFEWRITQGNATATFTTAENFIEVTQIEPTEMVFVSAASLCLEDGQSDIADAELTPFTITEPFDLSNEGPLGEAGEITIGFECAEENFIDPYDPTTTNAPTLSCFEDEYPTSFFWQSSNHGSGNITYEVTLEPSSLGTLNNLNTLGVTAYWTSGGGSGTLTVVGTNICTGQTASETISFSVDGE